MPAVYLLVGVVVGLTCGGALCWWLGRELARRQEQIGDLRGRLGALESENLTLGERLKTQISELESREERLRQQFENLANRIFDDKSERFNKQHEVLLTPLKERLLEFTRKVDDAYNTEARERHTLKSEIGRLLEINQQVGREAQELAHALRGDSKTQGDWGEMQLNLILERAGLREGEEFITQGRNLNLRDEGGALQKPDVIVHLPEKKHLVIDSKVSLTGYYDFMNAPTPEIRQAALKLHLISVRTHVDQLAAKHYQALGSLDCPDFVLLFMPLEPALSEALRAEPTLIQHAWDRKVAITSPTLLFAFLKTVASIWSRERQNRNALKIAEEGGKLYDKFVGFLEDLERLGKGLNDVQKAYQQSMSKLREGPGNLIGKVENLRDLGVKTKKRILDASLLDGVPRSEATSLLDIAAADDDETAPPATPV